VLSVAFALVLATLLVAPAGASAGWTSATDLSAKSEFGFDQEPRLAVSPSGGALAVWSRLDWLNTVQASSKLPGGAWGPPVTLSHPGEEARDPRVAINAAGQAVVIWHTLSSEGAVKAAIRTPQGSWGPVKTVSLPGYGAPGYMDIAMDPEGSAVAVWVGYDYGPLDYIIQTATMSAAGEWAEPVELTDGDYEGWAPRLTTDSATGRPLLVWFQPEGLPAEESQGVLPLVAAAARRETVVWERDGIVKASTSDDGGEWTEPVELSEPDSEEPSVAMDAAGNAIAIWRFDPGFGAGHAQLATLAAGEEEWTEPVTISERLTGEEARPQVAVDPEGRATAVWRGWNGSTPVVEAATGTIGGPWSAPLTLAPADNWSAYPAVAMDATGNAAAIWRAATPSTVEAAVLDITNPELRSLAIPGSGRAGRPVSFSASDFDLWSPVGSLRWTFGDGTAATGASVAHDFQQPGRYPVTVTATDAAGNSTARSGEIEITPALAAAQRVVTVKNRTAWLALDCQGTVVCRGDAALKRQLVSKKGRRHLAHLGGVGFGLGAGAQRMVPMRLTSKALKLLADAPARGLRARLRGDAVEARVVYLRPAPRARPGRP